MKYLNKFNEHKFDEASDLGEDIANDLIGRFQKMREEGKVVTVEDFDKYMSERGADSDLSHSVMNHLVNMGFDFDIEKEEDEYDEIEEPYIKENLGNITKVLLVTGDDDFHANSFEQKYGGTPVKDIIENISNYESDEWDLKVYTFGVIDPKFVKFIKSKIQDYDDSKNTQFYLDTENI